eukprot:803607-Pleurochrysis_carterae.AAC.2
MPSASCEPSAVSSTRVARHMSELVESKKTKGKNRSAGVRNYVKHAQADDKVQGENDLSTSFGDARKSLHFCECNLVLNKD